jgi:hypothetical protein
MMRRRVRLGGSRWFRRVYVRIEGPGFVLICAAPQTGKSPMLAGWLSDHRSRGAS